MRTDHQWWGPHIVGVQIKHSSQILPGIGDSMERQKFGGSGADPHSPQLGSVPGTVNDVPIARPSDPKDTPVALAN